MPFNEAYEFHYAVTCKVCGAQYIANRSCEMPIGVHDIHKCANCRAHYFELHGVTVPNKGRSLNYQPLTDDFVEKFGEGDSRVRKG
jgi:predicted nucleic-acid-binding Zn-ribbon protein